jgi:cytochrome c-type biogenesis protein
MGLSMMRVVQIPFLTRSWVLEVHPRKGVLAGLLLGATFALAWTPCVGPVLASILTLAAVSGSVSHGALLLFAYSMGLGVPFLAASFFMEHASSAIRSMRRLAGVIERVAGLMILAVGIGMLTGTLSSLNAWILRFTGFRPKI